MSELDELGIKYNCDKSSQNRRSAHALKVNSRGRGHDYLRKYEFFIGRFRDIPVALMELGIGPDWNMGASLRIWMDYFTSPKKKLTIVDINPKASRFSQNNVDIKIGDLGDRDFLRTLSTSLNDIIVDDASHFWDHQILAFETLFPCLNEGGVYVIEDIHTSFGSLRDKYANGSRVDAYQYLAVLASLTVGGNNLHPIMDQMDDWQLVSKLAADIESVTFVNHSCIICKKGFYR